MTETKRFCWALAAAVLSLSILAAMATSADQRQHQSAVSAMQTVALN